jgi:hypothetical protein
MAGPGTAGRSQVNIVSGNGYAGRDLRRVMDASMRTFGPGGRWPDTTGWDVTKPDRPRRLGYLERRPWESVAVLRNDGSAAAVAGAAVEEAVARRISVHFLQLVGAHHEDPERPFPAEKLTFRAGLHALRGHPRTPSVFEVVVGEPATVTWLRSQHAALLV